MKTLLLTACCILPFICKAQLSTDTITTKTLRNGNYRYYHGDIRLNETKLSRTVKTDPVAQKTMRAAQTNEVFGTILGASGGVLIGIPVGAHITGEKMNWGMAGVGLALAIGSYPLNKNAQRLKKKAIKQYNAGRHNRTTFLERSELNIGASGNGMGFTWRF